MYISRLRVQGRDKSRSYEQSSMMDEHELKALADRVYRLEIAVQELHRTVAEHGLQPTQLLSPSAYPPQAQPGQQPSLPPPPPTAPRPEMRLFPESFDSVRSGGWWLNKAGIALLLLGLAFLFKYAVDRGWLTEQVRVAFGLILGTLLLLAGLGVRKEHENFSQVLMGGSIAAYYITGYAAFQLYHLVDFGIAFGFMALITALALFLSVYRDGVVLALIGAIGGLATPFLLHTDTVNIPALIGYTCLVLAGTTAIFMFRGWYSLLWTSFVGGWVVFFLAKFFSGDTSISDKWSLQGGAVFALVAFWLLPVARKALWNDNALWLSRYSKGGDESVPEGMIQVDIVSLALLTFFTFLLVVTFSMAVWRSLVSQQAWGWIMLAGALAVALITWGLRSRNLMLAHMHALVAAGLLTLSLALLLQGSNNDNDAALYLALALEATALLTISRWFLRDSVSAAGHLVFLGLALWFTGRIAEGNSAQTAVFNAKGLLDLAVIALVFVASFFATPPKEFGRVYRAAAHVGLLAWLWREFSILPDGRPYITIAWGIYALGLLVAGVLLSRNRALINTAIATLFLVVAKLFLVDLAVDQVWRILLFLGFGGLFLFVSYYLQKLFSQPPKEAGMPGEQGEVRGGHQA